MADRGGNVAGFRQQPGQVREMRKARQEQERRVTAGEMAQNFIEVQQALQRIGKAVNDRTVRIEALCKTLFNAGVIKEEDFKDNLSGLRRVQSFVTTVMDDPKLDMRARVAAVVKFNETQPEDFKITDSYFPIRNWLVLNPDGLSLEEIGEIATAFGFSEHEVDKTLADVKVVEAQRDGTAP